MAGLKNSDSRWLQPKSIRSYLIIVAGWLGLEFAGWGVGKAFDCLTHPKTWAAISNWPWVGIFSAGALVVGLVTLFLPEKQRKPLHKVLHIEVDRALARYHSMPPGNWKDANRLGDSVAVTLKKAGFTVPPANDDWSVRAVMLENYFKEIANLLNDGHIKEAKAVAATTVKRLVEEFSDEHPER